jgi:hemoglobin
MVNTFYQDVRNDESLANIFDNIMQVNWEKHLPKMYDFWENVLFHTGNYNGRPFPPHVQVNEKITLTNEHFDAWIKLFEQNVDNLFEGEKANEVKFRAASIKHIFNSKINYINHPSNLPSLI